MLAGEPTPYDEPFRASVLKPALGGPGCYFEADSSHLGGAFASGDGGSVAFSSGGWWSSRMPVWPLTAQLSRKSILFSGSAEGALA